MTAAAQEVQATIERRTRMELPLAPGKKAYKGATAVGRPSTGYVYPSIPASGATSDVFLGLFAETIDNSANTATTLNVTVDFLKEKTLLWRGNDPGGGAIVATSRFNACYALDDQTVSTTTTNAQKMGIILDVDSVLGVAFEVEGL